MYTVMMSKRRRVENPGRSLMLTLESTTINLLEFSLSSLVLGTLACSGKYVLAPARIDNGFAGIGLTGLIPSSLAPVEVVVPRFVAEDEEEEEAPPAVVVPAFNAA